MCTNCYQQRLQGAQELRCAGLIAATTQAQTRTFVHVDLLEATRAVRCRLPGTSMAGMCSAVEDISRAHSGVSHPCCCSCG